MAKRMNRVAWGLAAILAVVFLLALAVGAVAGITAGNLTHYAYWNWRGPGSVVYSNGVWTDYGLGPINSADFFLWGGLFLGIVCGSLLGVWMVRRLLASQTALRP